VDGLAGPAAIGSGRFYEREAKPHNSYAKRMDTSKEVDTVVSFGHTKMLYREGTRTLWEWQQELSR